VTCAACTNARAGAQRGACSWARAMQAFLGNRDILSVAGQKAGLGFYRRGLEVG
jgi:hypothetical protein